MSNLAEGAIFIHYEHELQAVAAASRGVVAPTGYDVIN